MARVDVARKPSVPSSISPLVDSIGAFSMDLVRRLPVGTNLICSPFSVMVALAMVRNGATGQTAAQMDTVLHFFDLDAVNAGMNAIDQTLSSRSGTREGADGVRASVKLSLANSTWGQTGLTWQTPFLDVLARSYGTGVFLQDFVGDSSAARKVINAWVADHTADRIIDLLPPDVLSTDTRLVLVNALHLVAPWEQSFVDVGSRPFHTPSGELMTPTLQRLFEGRAGVVGDGWQAARIPLLGGELAMTVVLGDRDLPTLLADLDGSALTTLLGAAPVGGVDLTLPAFRFRSAFVLGATLAEMGMERAFTADAELGGLTADEQLKLSFVVHQGWITVDEDGVEAAAATAVGADTVSAPAPPRLTMVLDRPFLFCLHDVATAVPLLVGVVNDPTLT